MWHARMLSLRIDCVFHMVGVRKGVSLVFLNEAEATCMA